MKWSLIPAFVAVSAVLVLQGCGAGGGGTVAASKPEAYAGTWSFEDQPTADNPVREANLTITGTEAARLEIQGTMATALLEITVKGLGSIREGKYTADLDCTTENGNWAAQATFEVTSTGKLRARMPGKDGSIMNFELVKK